MRQRPEDIGAHCVGKLDGLRSDRISRALFIGSIEAHLCDCATPGVNLPCLLPLLLSRLQRLAMLTLVTEMAASVAWLFPYIVVPHVYDLVQLAHLGEPGSDRLDELPPGFKADFPRKDQIQTMRLARQTSQHTTHSPTPTMSQVSALGTSQYKSCGIRFGELTRS
jgi:hypothetical protein